MLLEYDSKWKSILEKKVRCVGIIYSKYNLRVIVPDYEQ